MGLLLLTDKGFDASWPRNLCEQKRGQKVLGVRITYGGIKAKKYATIIHFTCIIVAFYFVPKGNGQITL
jgi:hypothetical protein